MDGRAPITSLPAETLFEIFKFYLIPGERLLEFHHTESKHYTVSSYRYNYGRTPFQFASICRPWRELVKSTPSLWSCIAIDNPRVKNVGLIHFCLKTVARECPLHISLEWNGNMLTAPDVNVILVLLFGDRHLWKSIRFVHAGVLAGLKYIPIGSLGMLQHATIHKPDSTAEKLWAAIHSSRALCSVQWRNKFDICRTAQWRQLKFIVCTFAFDPDQTDVFLRALQLCAKLEGLKLKWGNLLRQSDTETSSASSATPIVTFSSDNLPPKTRFVTLPALKELELADVSIDCHDKLFKALTAPKLTRLHLYHMTPHKDFPAYNSFMLRSGCALHAFNLYLDEATPKELLKWIKIPAMSPARIINLYTDGLLDIDEELADVEFELGPNERYVDAMIAEVKRLSRLL